jgi:hypothetical protein
MNMEIKIGVISNMIAIIMIKRILIREIIIVDRTIMNTRENKI